MAKNTETRANQFKTMRANAFAPDGNHLHYSFVMVHPDGQVVKWTDDKLAANASKATVKAAMISYVQTQERQVVEAPVTITIDKHGFVGKVIKDV